MSWTAVPVRSTSQRFLLVAAVTLLGCGGSGDATRPAERASTVALELALPALDPAREGAYEAWAVSPSGGRTSLGRFPSGGARVMALPAGAVVALEVTVEPPGDADATPSAQVVLRGDARDGAAELGYAGAVTQEPVSLRTAPGQFTMFTPSDNDTAGYPSHEEAGVWLFNMSPAETAQRDYYVRMTQLAPGWTYEGWMVRDMGQPGAIWLSYGKFVPDWTGALNQPDDTGWGPFSGVTDYQRARLEDFPGDDWISNPLHLPWPGALSLPLDLRERDTAGAPRWSHVITIEPARDRGEPVTTERPFFMRPYVDPFGTQPAGVARTITPHFESMPHGQAVLR